MKSQAKKRTLVILSVLALAIVGFGVFTDQAFAQGATLTTLGKSAGKLTPSPFDATNPKYGFDPKITTYDIVVEFEDGEKFTLAPKTNIDGATFSINGGEKKVSGTAVPIPLKAQKGFKNKVVIEVFVPGGEKGTTYSVDVERWTKYTVKENPKPEWIFYDELNDSVTTSRAGGKSPENPYYEITGTAKFKWAQEAGPGGSGGMRALYVRDCPPGWSVGDTPDDKGGHNASGLKICFGRTSEGAPGASIIRNKEDFKDVYARWYLRHSRNWIDDRSHNKMVRFSSIHAGYKQSVVGHLWSRGDRISTIHSNGHYLGIDPVTLVDVKHVDNPNHGLNGDDWTLLSTKYNDFGNMTWQGVKTGMMPFSDGEHNGEWYCIELRLKLNDPGESNGISEFWIDDVLQASSDRLNLIGRWNPGVDKEDFHTGITHFFVENYSNASGSNFPQDHRQTRDWSNLVISMQKIGPAVFVWE